MNPEAVHLPVALAAWGQDHFSEAIKTELATINPQRLPLQQGLTQSSIALEDEVDFVFLSATEEEGRIRVTLGVFYKGLIAGCNCADDPSPADTQPEYCEVRVQIDMTTANATVTLAS